MTRLGVWPAEWDEYWAQAFIEPDLKTAHLRIYPQIVRLVGR